MLMMRIFLQRLNWFSPDEHVGDLVTKNPHARLQVVH